MHTKRNQRQIEGGSGRNRFPVKRIAGYTLMLAFAAALLVLSFRGVKWEDFAEGLAGCSWFWIIASMIFGISGFVIRALRWRMLLRELDRETSLRDAYHGVTIGNLANFALPRVGEIVRCGVASKRRRTLTFEGAVGTVVVERTWDLLCLVLLAALFVLFSWNKFGEFISAQIFDPSRTENGTSAVWTVALFVTVAAVTAAALVLLYLYRSKIGRWKAGEKLLSFCRKLWGGIAAAFRMKDKWLFFLLTALLWTSFWVTGKCTLMAFPAVSSLNWTDALFLMIAGSLGWAVPVQGGIGAYHFIVSLTLVQVYGTTNSEGLVFATVSHESQAVVMIICGAASLAGFMIKNRSLINSKRNI